MHPKLTFQPSILLTGATGLLGRSCLPHLIARHGAEGIVALVRRGRDTRELGALGVRCLEVDLCASNLGIPQTVFRRLSESIHSIIHAAADIRFGISLAQSRCVNVVGTENLLRFAAQCSRLDRFAHISTVYVWGRKPGHIREEAAQPGHFLNPYQQAKFEAEQVTLAAMSVIPAAIYRFSTMIYDRSAERVNQFNYFHQLLRLAAINPLPSIPALARAKIDLIASDWAARVFDFMFAAQWQPNKILHICAGPQNSLTIGELFELSFDLLGLAERKPKILTQEEFNANAASILSTASRGHMWQSLTRFLPHINVDQTFECTRVTEAIAGHSQLELPDSKSLFRDALSYCMATNWNQFSSAQLSTTA
jgi:nucleoside-diphosphate-sugar epimerase